MARGIRVIARPSLHESGIANQTLSSDLRVALRDAAIQARDRQRQVRRAAAGKAVDELAAKGMQFNENPAAKSHAIDSG